MKSTIYLFVLIAGLIINPFVIADEIAEVISENADAITDKAINVDNTKQPDSKIQGRLEDIYKELTDMKNVRVEVSNGIVTLSGEVSAINNQNIAVKLAKQIEGVVAVESGLEVTRAVDQRLNTVFKKVQNLFNQALESLPILIISLVTFIAFWLFGSWISHNNTLLQKITPNQFIANLLGQVLHLAIIIIGLMLALSLLDATSLLSTILGAAGIVGLAVGFAVKDTVENYIASILLSLRNPFEANDFVDIDGNLGSVARLTTRATILISPDGNYVRLPNAMVFKAVIVNYTRNPQRRFQFDIGVDSAQDLQHAQRLALDALNAIEGVLNEPEPQAFIEKLGDFNVLLRFYCWVDQENYSFGKVRSEAIRQCKRVFDQANIVMPEPIYQIRMNNTETLNLMNTVSDTKLENHVGKPYTENQPGSVIIDLSPDKSAELKVAEEISLDNGENLLNTKAPKE